MIVKDKWLDSKNYLDNYIMKYYNIDTSVSSDQFIELLFAGIEIFCKDKMEEKYDIDVFVNTIFNLKKDNNELLGLLMEDINFFYSNGKYLSDEIELSLINLQNSMIFRFNNPGFKTFEIKLKEEMAEKYIEDFINEFTSLNINRSHVKKYSEMFLKLYYKNFKLISRG